VKRRKRGKRRKGREERGEKEKREKREGTCTDIQNSSNCDDEPSIVECAILYLCKAINKFCLKCF
jgi:hypothetical protein